MKFWINLAIFCIFLLIFRSESSPVKFKDSSKIYFEASTEEDGKFFVNDNFEASNSLENSKDYSHEVGKVGNLECTTCRTLLKLALWKFRTKNGTYPGLPQFIDSSCKRLHIEANRVCDGLINIFKTEVLMLLTELKLTANDVCGLILPTTCYSPTLSWNKIKWNVTIPKKNPDYKNQKLYQESFADDGKVFRVLQISDAHLDMSYLPGSILNCKEPLCCQPNSTKSKVEVKTAGYWGSLGSCDTPYWTFENLLQFASSKQKFDYILWTGDLPAHNDWSQSKESQIELLKNMTATLLKYFPKTPIFPALGNHESNPVNSFPPDYVKGNHSISWLYTALKEEWSNWLPKEALETVEKYGYYTVLLHQRFRIVSLNMNYCNQQNWWMLINPVDPDSELKWLVDVLQNAESTGEYVHIIGHIPPGYGPDCLKIWSSNYYNIIDRYHHIIKGQFFGHTHVDEMEIFYDSATYSTPVNMAYIAPSITSYPNMNPGYRVYSVDGGSYEIVDFETYLLNLTKANANPHNNPTWDLEYSAKNTYNLTDLSPKSWDKLLNNWIKDDASTSSKTFDKYYQYFYKSNPPSLQCDKTCRTNLLCRLRSGKSDDNEELCKNIY